jgi:hypothetical protein
MELLDKLTPEQLLGAISTLIGGIVLIVFIVAIWHFQVKYLADDTALKREKQQADLALKQEVWKRNLPPAELRMTLGSLGLDGPADDLDPEERAALVRNLVLCAEGSPADAIEETVGLVHAADPATRKAVASAVAELAEAEEKGEHVLATIRAMCRGPRPAAMAGVGRG